MPPLGTVHHQSGDAFHHHPDTVTCSRLGRNAHKNTFHCLCLYNCFNDAIWMSVSQDVKVHHIK